MQRRMFSDAVLQRTDEAEDMSIDQSMGVDDTFDEEKHAYVLTFPWNFEEVIQEFDTSSQVGGYWDTFINNTRAIVDFNNLFREFHQASAIPDYLDLQRICEPGLADYVSESLKRIHFHGLDVEMANLTLQQPSIKVLRASIHQNLSVIRSQNMKSVKDYNVTSNHSIGGASWKTYHPIDESKNTRDAFDAIDSFHVNKPYLVQVTCVVESPMKLFVLNQNGSKVIFGSDDDEVVKNIVKFEANLRWFDFLNLLPVENKASIGPWKISDFNNIMNENPLFEDE